VAGGPPSPSSIPAPQLCGRRPLPPCADSLLRRPEAGRSEASDARPPPLLPPIGEQGGSRGGAGAQGALLDLHDGRALPPPQPATASGAHAPSGSQGANLQRRPDCFSAFQGSLFPVIHMREFIPRKGKGVPDCLMLQCIANPNSEHASESDKDHE
jgi:hypothetical protein